MERIQFIKKAFEHFNYHYESNSFNGTLTFKIAGKDADLLFDNERNEDIQKNIIFNNQTLKNFLNQFDIDNNKLKQQLNIKNQLDYYELEDYNNTVFNVSFDINESALFFASSSRNGSFPMFLVSSYLNLLGIFNPYEMRFSFNNGAIT